LKRDNACIKAYRRLRRSAGAVVCFIAAGLAGVPDTNAAEQSAQSPRPKIGLALSGGGARGAAHIGVLRELERMRIPIDYIAGTSMGSIVGGLYSAGRSPDELEQVIKSIDWDDIFSDRPPRRNLSMRRKQDDTVFSINKSLGIKEGKVQGPTGVIQGQKFGVLLREITAPVGHITDFDRFRIPFRAVAADIATGEQVVISHGSLATAMRASMAVPGAFASVEFEGHQLVDGGIANNLPVSVVRDMGADIVIAVDISTPLYKADEIKSAISIVLQLSGFLTRSNTEAQIKSLKTRDVLIVPNLGPIESGSFSRASEAIPLGAEATVKLAERLQGLSLSEKAYEQYLAGRREPPREPPVIDVVKIDNNSRMADEVIQSRLNVKTGQPLDLAALQESIDGLYGLDVFESITYNIAQKDGKKELDVVLREKRWGPRYLQFGLRFSTDTDTNSLGMVLGYTVTPINRLNGEWRSILRLGDDRGVVTELYQPVAVDSPYFVNPRLFTDSRPFYFRDGDRIIGQTRVERIGIELAAGRELANWGQFRFGARWFTGETRIIVGPPDVKSSSFDGAEIFAGARFDTMDDPNFPRSGAYATLDWTGSRDAIGADASFDQAQFDFVAAKTGGLNTLQFGVRYFTTFSGEAPPQNRFRTGGLFAMPGFSDNQLSGQQLVLLRAGYLRRLEKIQTLKSYLGATLQYGNVFERENDIKFGDLLAAGSIYFGAETPIGPAYIGVGYADTGSVTYYFTVGTRF